MVRRRGRSYQSALATTDRIVWKLRGAKKPFTIDLAGLFFRFELIGGELLLPDEIWKDRPSD